MRSGRAAIAADSGTRAGTTSAGEVNASGADLAREDRSQRVDLGVDRGANDERIGCRARSWASAAARSRSVAADGRAAAARRNR
jgi:hypothetical protein